MDLGNVITGVGASMASTVVLVPALGYVLKSIIGQGLARDIERFKADLACSLEQHKAELRSTGFEHETRFSRLHERRMEVLAEIYYYLAEGDISLNNAIHQGIFGWEEDQSIRNERARTSLREAWLSFQKNQLYIDLPTCHKIEDFFEQSNNAMIKWLMVGNPPGEESAKSFDDAITTAQQKVPGIRKSIETEFRKILGTTPTEG